MLSYRLVDTRGESGVEQVITRGVSFIRQVNGIRFNGIGPYGGVEVVFANDERMARLHVVWPKLEPVKSFPVATPAEMTGYIKRGESLLLNAEELGQILTTTNALKRIIVHEISPAYFGVTDEGAPGQRINPFAELHANFEFATTNFTAVLTCPLVAPER